MEEISNDIVQKKSKRSADLRSLSVKLEKYSFLLPVNAENNMNKENITYRMVSNCIKQNSLKEYIHVILSHVPMCITSCIQKQRVHFSSYGEEKYSNTHSLLC